MFSMAHKQPFLTYKFNKYLQQKTKKQKHLQQNISTRIATPPKKNNKK